MYAPGLPSTQIATEQEAGQLTPSLGVVAGQAWISALVSVNSKALGNDPMFPTPRGKLPSLNGNNWGRKGTPIAARMS
jgi:hypothetical protein